MNIIPINSNFNIDSIGAKIKNSDKLLSDSVENREPDFKEMFGELIKNVEETEAVVKTDSYNLSIGKADDMHTIMINAAKADLALQTMVQLRNKVLDAFNDVLRINI